ncbi:hypothetical protein [Herbiconiux sp. L3-i23]|uniref:hypothetical protein n=1 Tax=Herbiconiux sp. L3-i23 TaxID=2905871 RepID=UPI002072AF7A|nr:hypothetical protein [Herbiconiux sp. L3-i23]
MAPTVTDPAQHAELLLRRRRTDALVEDLLRIDARIAALRELEWSSPAAEAFRRTLDDIRGELRSVRAAFDLSAAMLSEASAS